jgi:hypothetical protein
MAVTVSNTDGWKRCTSLQLGDQLNKRQKQSVDCGNQVLTQGHLT